MSTAGITFIAVGVSLLGLLVTALAVTFFGWLISLRGDK